MTIEIREEQPNDIAAIRDVNKRTFGQDQEGNIVDALRSNGAALLSLVATLDNRVVGHIMYSPATINYSPATISTSPTAIRDVTGAALGPMAILPEHQRLGIGSKLVHAGNDRLRAAGHPFIIVLGHPTFYPRFGFRRASSFGVKCEWDVPDEALMLLVLDETQTPNISGLVKYRPEFLTQ